MNDPAGRLPVTYDDVAAAAGRLAGHAHRTPAMTSRFVDAATGARVFFKCENFQRIGAFKFRGAFNALSRLDAGARARGVVAYSSGNHAQAVGTESRGPVREDHSAEKARGRPDPPQTRRAVLRGVGCPPAANFVQRVQVARKQLSDSTNW